jgi:imidazoleglycerol-phosphate dehydratase
MRKDTIARKTKETDITVTLNLDGKGVCDISTGVGFFDHMLELFAVHGGFDLTVKCKGDLKVDGHHSVEDVGITLGKLINKLLGDKKGIARYACQAVPMDEALARVVLDLSGRPYIAYDVACETSAVGDFDCELAEEFFRSVAVYGMMTLHISKLAGKNTHHIIEACFKAFARALKDAVRITGDKVLSSKGVLE